MAMNDSECRGNETPGSYGDSSWDVVQRGLNTVRRSFSRLPE